MRNLVSAVLILFALIGKAQVDDDPTIYNQYIVMLQPGQKVETLAQQYPSLQLIKCLSHRMNIWLLRRSETANPEEFLSVLKKNVAVKLAQFNHRVERRNLIPNDQYFGNQWNMLNTAQYGGVAGDDIDATQAWQLNHNNFTALGDTIVIAIVDGFFDLQHQDLNFFVNHAEIPDNSIDDDGNGYVDDYYGWNAYGNNGNINEFGGDAHSMHVAGIAGAIGNDTVGVAGVCWGAKLLRVSGSSNTEAEVVNAYDYVMTLRIQYNTHAGTQGAFVVATNSSFGVNYGQPADYPIWCAVYDSMGALGILSAGATANLPIDVDTRGDIPTACPSKWLISVTNTTQNDALYVAAARGKVTIDIGAPGTKIYSTITSQSYDFNTGTSMASPHLAGTVGAMFAAACPALINDYYTYPDSIALVIKQMILDGTDRVTDLYNRTVSGGRLNLYHALRNLDEYSCDSCNLHVSLNITQPTCHGICNASAVATVSDTGTFIYRWSTGDSGVTALNNLCSGFYSVSVSDTSGACTTVRNFSIFSPDTLVVNSIQTIAATDSNSGNIIISASAGNYNLLYGFDSTNVQSSAILVFTQNGTFNVYVKTENGCLVENTVTVTSNNEVALDNSSVKVYPNPANEKLNVSLSLSQNSRLSFTLLNSLGQQVISEQKNISAGLHTATIDVAGLAPGFYLLHISTGSNSLVRTCVITH